MTDNTNSNHQPGLSTLSIWGGEQEHELYERSTQVPVVHSVSFAYKDIDTWHAVALEKSPATSIRVTPTRLCEPLKIR